MLQPPDNPYAAPQANVFPIGQERRRFHRSGGLLIVTLFHVTVLAICLTLAGLFSLGIALSNEWGRGPVSEDVLGLIILGLVPFLVLVLFTEFRGFRPTRRTERYSLYAVLSASWLPISVGCYWLLWFVRHANREYLNTSILWFTLALIWIASVGLRTWLAFRNPGNMSKSVFSDEPPLA